MISTQFTIVDIHFTVVGRDGSVIMRGESSLGLEPPIGDGQIIVWSREPAPADHRYDLSTGLFVPAEPPADAIEMAPLRAAARVALDEVYASRLNAILGPLATVRARKADEARRVADGGGSAMLQAEADALDIEVSDLAVSILAKSDEEAATLGAIEGQRQAAQAAIDAAASPIELDAILSQFR